jgi:transcriptional regulator with XRE-family HTH domain
LRLGVNDFFFILAVVRETNIPRLVSLEVARLLRSERVRRGMSMTQVAEKSGLSRQMISYIEQGMRNPTLDTLLRIAIALDVDLSKLIKRASTARSSARQ